MNNKFKKIAILATGPSINRSWKSPQSRSYDLVVGVNRSGIRFEVDYLAYLDERVMSECQSKNAWPRAGIVTRSRNLIRSSAIGTPYKCNTFLLPLYNYPVAALDSAGITVPNLALPCRFTLPCAVMWVMLNFDYPDIDIYGVDFSSDKGVRWIIEAPWLAYCIARMGNKGTINVLGELSDDWFKYLYSKKEVVKL